MSSILCNLGCGPVAGPDTYENAEKNIYQFLADCEVPMQVALGDHSRRGDGRYRFLLTADEQSDKVIEILMPGLPLEKVRYMGTAGQNIIDYPRLLVDGASYVWKYALITKEVFDALMEGTKPSATESDGEANAQNIFGVIIKFLPLQPRGNVNDNPGFWTDGEEILCPSEAECNAVADLLRDMLSEYSSTDVLTGYYDPAEEDEHDIYTGFWYVTIE